MPNRSKQQVARRNNNRAPKHLVNPRSQLVNFKRNLTFYKEIDYTGWTNLGSVHIRSGNNQLRFTASNLPGWTSISQNWDQYKIGRVHYHFINDSIVGATGINNAGRVYTLLSAYDPDGGTESAVDILSRNNLSIQTLGYASSNTATLTCVPGYNTTDGENRKGAWMDQTNASVNFHTFQTVVDTLRNGINPGDSMSIGCYVTVELHFRGAR